MNVTMAIENRLPNHIGRISIDSKERKIGKRIEKILFVNSDRAVLCSEPRTNI